MIKELPKIKSVISLILKICLVKMYCSKSDLLYSDRIIFVYLQIFSSKADDNLVDATVKNYISLSMDQIFPARSLALAWMVQVSKANLFRTSSMFKLILFSCTSPKYFSRSVVVCQPLPK